MDNADCIVTVDYYSRYFVVEKITSVTSSAVIQKLKAVFAKFARPQMLISDNGPCYGSREFEDFHAWNFDHITSGPLHPQSNRLAERTVQTSKALMDKAHAQQADPYLSRLENRNTPIEELKSPA